MEKTVGFYGGKFFPIHNGHVAMMEKARQLVDELHIIVSHDEAYERNHLWKTAKRKGHEQPSYIDRYRWWCEIVKEYPNVHVHTVRELQTGKEEDWAKGAEGIREVIGKPIDKVFSSEPSYDKYFSKLYPEAEHVVLDVEREEVNISATMIREDLFKYWDFLPKPVQEYFVKVVVVTGVESCGKSTLVKRLAEHFDTNYVTEYGREFYEDRNIFDMRYTKSEDYMEIAIKHLQNIADAKKNANKLLFVDTDVVVTAYYHNLYLIWQTHRLEFLCENTKQDLYLFASPEVPWVADGSRTLSNQQEREMYSNQLWNVYRMYEIYPEPITGSSYESRYLSAVSAVERFID